MNYTKLREVGVLMVSVMEGCYVIILVLSFIVVISIMVSDVLVPKLGNSKPNIVIANKTASNVADNRMLSFIFKTASERSEKLFASVCESCHNINEGASNKVGPNLWNVVFRKIASVANFRYSPALTELSKCQWTLKTLNKFIKNPVKYVPGTNMSFSGLIDPFERMQILRYLIVKANYPIDISMFKFKP
ncbi:MAG: c-type cytochrome [Candidatus Hodgkinia cicadicola]